MTQDKQNNWQRLEAVISWANMSINYFARHIGLPRGENLYQIRRGNNGISKDVAHRVVTRFPEISESWLLTGDGHMFANENLRGAQIPFFRLDVERFATQTLKLTPDELIVFPSVADCDMAMLYSSDAMTPRIPAGSIVFLKQIDPATIIPGEEYVISNGNIITLRRVRTAGDDKWRLESYNKERYDDWEMPREEVRQAWKICGRMVLNS